MNVPAPKSVPKWLALRVLDWSDERHMSGGDSIIITLVPGFCFHPGTQVPGSATHVRGSATVREAIDRVRGATRCTCERCVPATCVVCGGSGKVMSPRPERVLAPCEACAAKGAA